MKPSKEPLLTVTEIHRRVAELAETLSSDFAGKEIVVIPVLKGGFHFASDLTRLLSLSLTLDFIRARSYRGERSKGTVEFLLLPTEPLTGKHVIVVEDILDTGRTTAAVLDRIQAENPESLSLCVLLDKPANREVDVSADYVGFQIDNHFVVGYGLDYNEHYRELPAVHILESG